MIGSTKQCLRKVIGNARLSADELSTILTEIECTLNCRPLTYEYNEVGEEVLTPSHLLHGRRIMSIPDEVIEPADVMEVDINSRFRYLNVKLAHFWNRWHKEYLTDLREHHRLKGKVSGPTIKIGDVVLVLEENKRRNKWKIGVIKSEIKGRDNVVRGARVRVVTKGKPKVISRPVQKLYPIEVQEEQEKIEDNKLQEGGGRKVGEQMASTRMHPKRAAALDATWKTKAMLDSCLVEVGGVLGYVAASQGVERAFTKLGESSYYMS